MNIISMNPDTSSLKLAVLDENQNILESSNEKYSYNIPEPYL